MRPWRESDLEDFYAYASVPGVGEMAGWPHHESLDDTRRVLSKDHWGKGLMPEAVKRVLRFCFDQLYLDAVTVGHFTDNSQSRRVIEKCGFTLCQKAQYASQYDLPPQEEMQYILWREDMK